MVVEWHGQKEIVKSILTYFPCFHLRFWLAYHHWVSPAPSFDRVFFAHSPTTYWEARIKFIKHWGPGSSTAAGTMWTRQIPNVAHSSRLRNDARVLIYVYGVCVCDMSPEESRIKDINTKMMWSICLTHKGIVLKYMPAQSNPHRCWKSSIINV